MFREIVHTFLVPANLIASKARAEFSRVLSFRTQSSVYVADQKMRVKSLATFLVGLAFHILSMQVTALLDTYGGCEDPL